MSYRRRSYFNELKYQRYEDEKHINRCVAKSIVVVGILGGIIGAISNGIGVGILCILIGGVLGYFVGIIIGHITV